MTVKPKTDTESADVDVAGISVKVKVHYPGRSHFAHESGAGLFSRFEKSAEGIVGHINQWLKARTIVLIGVDSLKSVRRGKRRKRGPDGSRHSYGYGTLGSTRGRPECGVGSVVIRRRTPI
jgi:hypothetical protein